jgi:hypothetical protein
MKRMQRNMVALLLVGLLSLGLVGPVAAQVNVGSGLVNVQIGNVSILNNLNVGVAAEIVAQICDISISNVAVLAEQVVRTGRERTVCTANGQPIIISQSN